jgi:hypothetical protein
LETISSAKKKFPESIPILKHFRPNRYSISSYFSSVIPAQAGIQQIYIRFWILSCEGITICLDEHNKSQQGYFAWRSLFHLSPDVFFRRSRNANMDKREFEAKRPGDNYSRSRALVREDHFLDFNPFYGRQLVLQFIRDFFASVHFQQHDSIWGANVCDFMQSEARLDVASVFAEKLLHFHCFFQTVRNVDAENDVLFHLASPLLVD